MAQQVQSHRQGIPPHTGPRGTTLLAVELPVHMHRGAQARQMSAGCAFYTNQFLYSGFHLGCIVL